MPIPQIAQDDFISNEPLVYLKYYLWGTGYNPDMSHIGGNETIEWVLNHYYSRQKIIKEEPTRIVSRIFQTHYFVYEVNRETRNKENDLEFVELECTHYRKFKEIWRCFFRPQQKDVLDLNPRVDEVVNPLGNFFTFPYKDLEGLIANNIIQGWTKDEVIASIHNLLNLNIEELTSFEREKVKHLRELVNQNPEIINQSEAA
ncbi:MAG: hypothetical protein PUP92_33610 [Rhizonema sp. PD38]|nr:hypothetical protein [Rhizonema sp. PD38]